MLGETKDLIGHGSREQGNLDVSGEELEDVLDLLLETTRKHLIGFIHDENTQVVCFENAALHHIMDTAGGSDNNMNTAFHLLDILFNRGTTDAGVDLTSHVLTNGLYDEGNLHRKLSGWSNNKSLDVLRCAIDCLQCGNCKGTCLTSSRLSLGDGVMTLNDW